MTQAAVSASLAALQKSLGVPLLAPDGRGLRLTEAGQAYAGYVRRILGLLDEAGLAATAAADPERGELRIAAVTTAAEQIAARATGRLPVPASAAWASGWRRATGSGSARCSTGIRWTWCSAAAPSRAGTCRCSPSGRTSSSWWPARLAAGAPAPGPAPQLVPWLAGQPWLLREPGSGTRAATDALLAELDIAPPTLMVGSNGAIRGSASVGLGVTLVSRDAVAAELADGRLAELPVPGTPLHRDWYLVAHPGPVTAPGRRLVEHMLSRGGFRPPTVNAEL